MGNVFNRNPYLGATVSLAEQWFIAIGVPTLLSETKVGHLGDVVVQQNVVNFDVPKEYKNVSLVWKGKRWPALGTDLWAMCNVS